MKQAACSNTTAYKGPELSSVGTNFTKPTSQLKNTDEEDTDPAVSWQHARARNFQGTLIFRGQITSWRQSNDRLPQNTNTAWNLLPVKRISKREGKTVVHDEKKETAILPDAMRNQFGFTNRFNLLTQTGNWVVPSCSCGCTICWTSLEGEFSHVMLSWALANMHLVGKGCRTVRGFHSLDLTG